MFKVLYGFIRAMIRDIRRLPWCEHCSCIREYHTGYDGRLGCIRHPHCSGWKKAV